MRCEERRDPILYWVMGQLEGEEAEDLRTHLRSGCAECAGYVTEARELQLGLLLAPDPADPSPTLERRLLARVSASPDSLRSAPPRRRAPWRWATAAALVALAAGLVGYRLGDSGADPAALVVAEEVNDELRDALEQLDEADAELAELEARLVELEGRLEESDEQVELLRAPDVQRVELNGTGARPEASAFMFWQWEEGYYCYLYAWGLPQPEGDGIYALWMENERGERILVGSFLPDPAGEGVVWAKLPADAGRAARAVVTLESGEPGQQPRGPVQLVSS